MEGVTSASCLLSFLPTTQHTVHQATSHKCSSDTIVHNCHVVSTCTSTHKEFLSTVNQLRHKTGHKVYQAALVLQMLCHGVHVCHAVGKNAHLHMHPAGEFLFTVDHAACHKVHNPVTWSHTHFLDASHL